MQARRSNDERSATTRRALVAAARDLFIAQSYAGTSTPDLVKAAGVTRGALYHHYMDKQALFRAVIEAEAEAVAVEVRRRSAAITTPMQGLRIGGEAFLDAMSVTGRTNLLLIEAPAVLGRDTMSAIDAATAKDTLREGLQAAIGAGDIKDLPLNAVTDMLSAVFDRAALAIAEGQSRHDWQVVIDALLEGLKAR